MRNINGNADDNNKRYILGIQLHRTAGYGSNVASPPCSTTIKANKVDCGVMIIERR